jgi:NADPH-dependent ferric siderophore reductase
MLISTNIASTKPTKHTEDVNKAEDKALAHTKETVQRTYTIKKNTREAKEIKDSNKKSAMSVIN